MLRPTSVLFYSPAYQWRHSWFLHDVAKIQTKKLFFLSVYFHEVLQQLNICIFTNLQLEINERKGPNSFWDWGGLTVPSFCVTRNLNGYRESSYQFLKR